MSTDKEQAGRLAHLREDLAALRMDAAVVSSLPNVRYLSGFTGSNGMLLVSARQATLYTDPRYTVQAESETGGAGIRVVIATKSLEEAVSRGLSKRRAVGFENDRVAYRTWEHLEASLRSGAKLIPLGNTIESRRMVKSDAEIQAIRESVHANSEALAQALKHFRAGMTEKDLAAEIEHQMRILGGDKPSFDTIVAYRANSALPHARPGDTRIDGNGLLLVDMGTTRGGYASDMTRCFHLGKPGTKTRKMYQAVLEAQLAGEDAVVPGIEAGAVDAAARKVLRRHGLGDAFIHSTGHGLGLEIHEAPRLGRGDATRLQAGMAITIEPGAYVAGSGGVRIEDTVLVTRTGVEILTPTTKELVIL